MHADHYNHQMNLLFLHFFLFVNVHVEFIEKGGLHEGGC